MAFFDGTRGRMHYRRWPVDSEVAVVVLLPGIGQHTGHYHHFARALRADGIEIWGLDTAGHGLSEGDQNNPGTLAQLVADATILTNLVRMRFPETPLILMGHSLGAVTALGMLGAAVPNRSSATDDLNAVEAKYPRTPSLDPTALTALIVSAVPKRALGAGAPESPGTPLPHTLPILALHGTDDRRAPIEAMREWTDRHTSVELNEYADAGHDLLHEPVQAQVAADIADWIQRIR